MTLSSELKLVTWEETEVKNQMSQATATYQIDGDFSGTLISTYVIHYTQYNPLNIHGGRSTYLGYGSFNGQIKQQTKEVLIEEHGCFEDGVTTGHFTFSNGSGRYFLLDGKMIVEIN